MDKIKEDSYQLWRTCFQDSEEYMHFYFQEKCKDNRLLTLYEGNVLTSMIHLNPYHVMWEERRFLLHYMVGIATEPSYRKQGRMRRLMRKAFAYMRSNGEPFTYLMPANERIYHPFDFRNVYVQNRVEIDPGKLSGSIHGNIEVIAWNKADDETKGKACIFATQRIGEKFRCYSIRTIAYYERIDMEMRAAGGSLLIFGKTGHVVGIASYMCENGSVEVTETICSKDSSCEIVETMYHAIIGNHGMGSEARKYLFLESAFLCFPADLVLKREGKPIIMMRILDMASFLSTLPGRDGEEYVIQVKDNWIPENNGIYHLFWNEGKSQVKRTDGTERKIEKYEAGEILSKFGCRLGAYLNEIV